MFRVLCLLIAAVFFGSTALASISGIVVPQSQFPPGNTVSAVPYTGFETFAAQTSGVPPTTTFMNTISDYLVSSGLQAAWGGTTVLLISEFWPTLSGNTVVRDGSGHATPNGSLDLSAVVSHAKANGQAPGLYRDGGPTGCFNEIWGANTLNSDVTYWISLGFEYFKIDGCTVTGGGGFSGTLSGRDTYGALQSAMQATGKPIILEYGYPVDMNQTWAYRTRTGGASRYAFDILQPVCSGTWSDITNAVWEATRHPGVVGPYHFADGDNLAPNNNGVGGTLTTNEALSQMGLYALMGSPWIVGCDPRNIGTTEMAALKNADLLSILKDPWVSGFRHVSAIETGASWGLANSSEIFYKRLSSTGSRAIAVLNANDVGQGAQTLTVDPSLMGIDTTQPYSFKNVITGATTSGQTGTFSAGSVGEHGTAIFLLTGGTENNALCWGVNPGGNGQIADGYPGGCAFQKDNNGNPANAASGVAGPFGLDGIAASTASAITTTGLTNPAAQGCYQNQRKGVIATDDAHEAGIEYIADNLVAGATYHYRVHLAEIDGNTAGQRLWNLTINTGAQSVPALTSEDIYADAGNAGNKAVIKEGNITADHGYLSFDFEPLSPPTGVPTTGCIEVIKQ